jgi:hypothetical protein
MEKRSMIPGSTGRVGIVGTITFAGLDRSCCSRGKPAVWPISRLTSVKAEAAVMRKHSTTDPDSPGGMLNDNVSPPDASASN